MEINGIIKQNLIEMGENYESLKPFIKDYLIKIETIITTKKAIQNESLKEIKNNSFSVSLISKELGCSRTTLYNHNQLLKRYIEFSESLFNQGNPFISYEDLKASVKKLKDQISLMEDRDIHTEILKQEKSQMVNMLKEKNKQIERLHARVNELSSELHKMHVSVSSNKVMVKSINVGLK